MCSVLDNIPKGSKLTLPVDLALSKDFEELSNLLNWYAISVELYRSSEDCKKQW